MGECFWGDGRRFISLLFLCYFFVISLFLLSCRIFGLQLSGRGSFSPPRKRTCDASYIRLVAFIWLCGPPVNCVILSFAAPFLRHFTAPCLLFPEKFILYLSSYELIITFGNEPARECFLCLLLVLSLAGKLLHLIGCFCLGLWVLVEWVLLFIVARLGSRHHAKRSVMPPTFGLSRLDNLRNFIFYRYKKGRRSVLS
jgi:hypothetical protein